MRILRYTLVLWGLTLVFGPAADLGPIYGVAAVVLGAVFTWPRCCGTDPPVAMRVFTWSITYLTLLFAAMALDELVRFGL